MYSLSSDMDVEFLINEYGMATLLHSKPLSFDVSYLHYEPMKCDLQLVDVDGQIIPSGLDISDQLAQRMRMAENVFFSEYNEIDGFGESKVVKFLILTE